MRLEIICILVLLAQLARSQGTCKEDQDCGESAPCCSDFGYCGSGEGFCSPAPPRATSNAGAGPPSRSDSSTRRTSVRRSGSGCVLDDVEYVGGDLSPIEGGGGVRVDRNSSKECYNKCEENFRCNWYTYDEREKLCYLKYTRGYPRERKDGFISGSTDRDGCDRDPECRFPYSYYSLQCMFYYDESLFDEISIADVRRNYNQSREICGRYGGFVPYEFRGYSGYRRYNDWHWLGYPGEGGNCWAGRPGLWSEGVRLFPCDYPLNFGCQNRGLYPSPIPRRPSVYKPRLPALPSLPDPDYDYDYDYDDYVDDIPALPPLPTVQTRNRFGGDRRRPLGLVRRKIFRDRLGLNY